MPITPEQLIELVNAFNWSVWTEKLRPDLEAVRKDVVKTSAQSVLEQFKERTGGERAFEVDDPFGQAVMTGYVGERIVSLDATTRDEVSALIRWVLQQPAVGVNQPTRPVNVFGLGTAIAEKVRERYEGWARWRADRIARTETAIAYNHGTVLGYYQAGVTRVKVLDGDCDICKLIDGQEWPLDQALANPVEHPNCERQFAPLDEAGEPIPGFADAVQPAPLPPGAKPPRKPRTPKDPMGKAPKGHLTLEQATAAAHADPGKGSGFAFDGDGIEGLHVRVRAVRFDPDAKRPRVLTSPDGPFVQDFAEEGWRGEWTEYRFKLTEAQANAQARRLRARADAQQAGWRTDRFSVPFQEFERDAEGRILSPSIVRGVNWKTEINDRFNAEAHTLYRTPQFQTDGAPWAMRIYTSQETGAIPFSYRNTVQVWVKGRPDPATFRSIMGEVGIEPVYPTATALEGYRENALARFFARGGQALDPQRKREALERARALGITIEDVSLKADPTGRPIPTLSASATKKLASETGVKSFTHSISGGASSVDSLVSILQNPQEGLLSTTRRMTEGIGRGGASSTTDVETGGADYVFTRHWQTAQSDLSHGTLRLKPSILRRLDSFSYSEDMYGVRNPNNHNARHPRFLHSDNLQSLSTSGYGSQETMFRERVGWEDVDALFLADHVRTNVIGRLRALGVTRLFGKPLEKAIRPAS